MALISVIIPAFNVEKHLSKCLESVLQQSFEDWEVILVDDGSTDGTGCIADTFAKKDSRIHVFHTGNGGVSSARNLGIQYAKGEWLTFVDSDDCIESSFFEIFVDRLDEKRFELFMGDVKQISLENQSFVEYGLRTTVCSLKEAIQNDRILRSGDLHAKMFNVDIIKDNSLSFDEKICYSEDRLFFDSYLLYVSCIALDSTICYNYRRMSNGLSYKLNDFESEYLCYQKLKCALTDVAMKNNLSVYDLLHNAPVIRTIDSCIKSLSFAEFSFFCSQLSDVDRIFFSKVLSLKKMGILLKLFFSRELYFLLFFFLKVFNCLRKK